MLILPTAGVAGRWEQVDVIKKDTRYGHKAQQRKLSNRGEMGMQSIWLYSFNLCLSHLEVLEAVLL